MARVASRASPQAPTPDTQQPTSFMSASHSATRHPPDHRHIPPRPRREVLDSTGGFTVQRVAEVLGTQGYGLALARCMECDAGVQPHEHMGGSGEFVRSACPVLAKLVVHVAADGMAAVVPADC